MTPILREKIYFKVSGHKFVLLISLLEINLSLNIHFFRRKVEGDVPSLSWDEALARDDVDALIICTENDTHEEYAR